MRERTLSSIQFIASLLSSDEMYLHVLYSSLFEKKVNFRTCHEEHVSCPSNIYIYIYIYIYIAYIYTQIPFLSGMQKMGQMQTFFCAEVVARCPPAVPHSLTRRQPPSHCLPHSLLPSLLPSLSPSLDLGKARVRLRNHIRILACNAFSPLF